MFSKFNESVQKVLIEANKESSLLKHEYVGSEHLFLSLLNSDNSFSNYMNKYNVDYSIYKEKLIELVGIGNSESTRFLCTPLLKKILEESILLCKEKNNQEVEIEDIVMSTFEEEEGIGIKVLNILGITDEIIDGYYSIHVRKEKKEKRKLLVEKFGVDLTVNNDIDPVIGRDKEIKRMMEILCRKYKNNPLLIGPAGVGKTAIVEELARRIVEGNVPDKLKDKRIISVSLSSLVANTKYRGEFEERITKMLKEIEEEKNIILFIDEIHTIMGAGGAEGAIDAANIFKPALARGNIKLIGATTLDEYKSTIEKDKAMERRFQKINVLEPTKEETMNILVGLRPVYEKYHNVKIEDNILEDIINLSDKYIYDKYEPDKSIDILDDICSRSNLIVSKNSKKINDLKLELKKLKKEKNQYLFEDDYINAYKIKSKEKDIVSKIEKLESGNSNDINKLNVNDIYEVLSMKTGISISRLKGLNDKDILELDKYLKNNIFGQDEAINNLIRNTRMMRYYVSDRPLSFLFVGPSGCGKTKLATLYGKYLFENIIRFDGSEYKEKESINKILGSPSGYVGYGDNKNKLEEVRNHPYSLILFDEVEKACADVVNLFLQILDEGKVTDNRGNVIRFNNCVIVMTSNLGFNKNDVGFVDNDNKKNSEIREYLSNELVNRVKNIIYFDKLNYEDIYSILKRDIINIKNKLKIENIHISFNKSVIDSMIEETKYLEYGARRVENVLEDYVDRCIIDNLARKSLKQIS